MYIWLNADCSWKCPSSVLFPRTELNQCEHQKAARGLIFQFSLAHMDMCYNIRLFERSKKEFVSVAMTVSESLFIRLRKLSHR